jgi:AraC family transcriptional regulator
LEKIAVARGQGWTVSDIVCTAGPRDRRFEEQHTSATIAIVVSGSFQYTTAAGRAVMTPGSLLLGNPGHYFECGHEHAVGDHCISFQYDPAYFDDATPFPSSPSVPPVRPISSLTSRVSAALGGSPYVSWEELAVALAGQTLHAVARSAGPVTLDAESRVTRVVRLIDNGPGIDTSLARLASEANLSAYHFLRTFQRVTGVTPHQYVLRTRLRRAAVRLATEPARVIDIALESGFADLSNFNRTFRAEFGVSPRAYRHQYV